MTSTAKHNKNSKPNSHYDRLTFFLHIRIEEGSMALSTVVTITHLSHEASNSSNRTVLSKTSHLAITLHPVVLESLKRNGLVTALDLLWLGVHLLLTLLSSSAETKDQVKGGFLLDVVIAQCTAIFKLFSRKDETLLIGRNTLLVLNLGLDIINSVRRLDIQRDSLAYQRNVS